MWKPLRNRATALLSAQQLPRYVAIALFKMLHKISSAFSDILSVGDRQASAADSTRRNLGGSDAHSSTFPAPIFASSTPFCFGDTTISFPQPTSRAFQAGDAAEQNSSPTGHSSLFLDNLLQPCGSFAPDYSASFIPLPDFLPSGSYTPISCASQPASSLSTSTESTQPFSVDAEVINAPPLSDALDLDWLIRFFQLQPPVNPQGSPSSPQGPTSFLQSPLYQFDSSLNNVIYDPFTSGLSKASCSSATESSDSVPCSPELMYPSPDQEVDFELSVADNEKHVSPSLSQPQAGPMRRPRSQTARDPLYSTGRYTCRYHGCPWRFRNARMCNRHEQTHNEANAYFCCNPRCSTNTGKRKAGFPRRDSIRRHYAKKSPDDPCVVMAKSLGWTGELMYEEEMFRVPPTPAVDCE